MCSLHTLCLVLLLIVCWVVCAVFALVLVSAKPIGPNAYNRDSQRAGDATETNTTIPGIVTLSMLDFDGTPTQIRELITRVETSAKAHAPHNHTVSRTLTIGQFREMTLKQALTFTESTHHLLDAAKNPNFVSRKSVGLLMAQNLSEIQIDITSELSDLVTKYPYESVKQYQKSVLQITSAVIDSNSATKLIQYFGDLCAAYQKATNVSVSAADSNVRFGLVTQNNQSK